jgi:hypothetical protein
MFPPADQSFTNACLPEGWREYSAYSGLFALIATLMIQFIQTWAVIHFSHHDNAVSPIEDRVQEKTCAETGDSAPSSSHHTHVEVGALTMATNTHSDGCCDIEKAIRLHATRSDHRVTAYLLEMGVLLHSVMYVPNLLY